MTPFYLQCSNSVYVETDRHFLLYKLKRVGCAIFSFRKTSYLVNLLISHIISIAAFVLCSF